MCATYYLNNSFIFGAGLKLKDNLGGMSMRCCVTGLTDTRSSFFFTSNTPKFWTVIAAFSPSS